MIITEDDWEKIIANWEKASEAGAKACEDTEGWEAIKKVFSLESNPELHWEFILRVYKRNLSENVEMALAAGPLETFIHNNGENFIEIIEKLAKSDEKFKNLLGGVWKCSTPRIWKRIEAIRGPEWDY